MKTKKILIAIFGSLLGLTSLGLVVYTFILDREERNYYAQNSETATNPGIGLWILMFLLIVLAVYFFKTTFSLMKKNETEMSNVNNKDIVGIFFAILFLLFLGYVFFAALVSVG